MTSAVRPRAGSRFALAALLMALGCAQGATPDPTEPDAARPELDVPAADAASLDVRAIDARPLDARPLDTPSIDTPAVDTPSIDAPTLDAPTLDAPTLDAPTLDAPTLDAPTLDTPVAVDLPPPDLGRPEVAPIDTPPPDTGPVGPVACTPSTAATVCGGRPCVDGWCCDSACAGPCRSCALAGREGRCAEHAADTDPESECAAQAPATCGTTGVCNGAGACARHPAGTACDDGLACTAGDACDVAGACRGDAPATCAPAAGNECCVGSCDPATGCRTAAGLCADRCDATRLRTARVCQGCGAARAAGTCGGGGEFACDATTHPLCQAIPCGGQTFVCTNDGGVWQWRTAARCDDGDACTHSDACAAGACRGAAVSCASDACAARACTGAATCAVTPRPGAACDDGNPTTNSDTCSAAGVCVGAVVCALPADACADGTQSRDRCAGARVIGRRAAASAAGYTAVSDTCSASNRLDDCAWDAGGDHTYRLWARAGETVSAALTRGTGCDGTSWNATLKLYQGADCSTVTCSGDRWCRDRVNTTPQTYVAARDGWLVIVVDGTTAFEDEGDYTLRVRLTGCRDAACDCP